MAMSDAFYPGIRPGTLQTDMWRRFLDDLRTSGINIDPLQSGGYNPRNIAGTSTPSLHGSDRAYDVNWRDNPVGPMDAMADMTPYETDIAAPTRIPPWLARDVAGRHGLRWGGDFRGRSPDPMHFEVGGGVPMAQRSMTAAAGLPAAPFGAPTGIGSDAVAARGQPALPPSWLGSLQWMLPPEMRGAGTIPNLDAALPPEMRGPPPPSPGEAGTPPVAAGPPAPPGPVTAPFSAPQVNLDAPFPAPPDPSAIMAGAQAAQDARPPAPTFWGGLERAFSNPLTMAGLSILGTAPGGNWGPAGAQGFTQAQAARREQTAFERQQRQRGVMDRIWAEAFPGGQPNMQHPLLAGQPPQVAAMIAGLGPETALPLLAKSAMERRQLEFKTAGDQAFIFDPRTGQSVPVPGARSRAPEAIRTNALRSDAAYRSLTTALDDYQRIVEREGITATPGPARDAAIQARTNIQLQLKELYNLGVLNGPDLDLMEKMLTDTSLSAGNVFSNPAGRVRQSVQRLKAMLRTVRDNAAAAAGEQPQEAPRQRLRYDPTTGELVNAN